MNLSYVSEETRALILHYGFQLHDYAGRKFKSPNIKHRVEEINQLSIRTCEIMNPYIWISGIQRIVIEYCYDVYYEVMALLQYTLQHDRINRFSIPLQHDDEFISDIVNPLIGNDEFICANAKCKIAIEFPKSWKITIITQNPIQVEQDGLIVKTICDQYNIERIFSFREFCIIIFLDSDKLINNHPDLIDTPDSILYSDKSQYKQYKLILSFVQTIANSKQ